MFSKLGFKSSSDSNSSKKKKKTHSSSSSASSSASQRQTGDNIHDFGSAESKKKLTYDPNGPVELAISIESPPCVMYGTTSNSTGALLSGLLTVIVKPTASSSLDQQIDEPDVYLTYVKLKLIQKFEFAAPFIPEGNDVLNNCPKCLENIVELANWDIVKDSTSIQTNSRGEQGIQISVGEHSYPFSQLLSGRLPPSSKYGSNADSRMSYELIADLQYYIPSTVNKHVGKNNKKNIVLELPVQVSHSILRGHDKNSIRVFPPTNVTATCTLPNVVYPKSTFPLELRLEGVSSDVKRWRMRSLNWKIEEKIKIRQHSCDSHKGLLKKLENQIRCDQNGASSAGGSSSSSTNNRHRNIGQRRPLKKTSKNVPVVTTSVIDEGNEQILLGPITSNDQPDLNTSSRNNNIAAAASNSGIDTVLNNAEEEEEEEDPDHIPPVPVSDRITQPQSTISTRLTTPNEDYNGTVHPNDYVLRQELINQQTLLRAQQIEQERKKDISLYTEEVRVIAHNTMKNGWKSDFDNGGSIEVITDIDCMHLDSGITNSKRHLSSKHFAKNQAFLNYLKTNKSNISCDVEDPVLGIYISHILVVEIVVAEEALQYANGAPLHPSVSKKSTSTTPQSNTLSATNSNSGNAFSGLSSKKSNSNTESALTYKPQLICVPTGAARVLRMQFRLNFTERSGIGIPWDDEVPPTYQDIKYLSPPSYKVAMSPVMASEFTFNHPINNLHSAISRTFLENLNGVASNTSTMSSSRTDDDTDSLSDQDTIDNNPNELNPPPLAHFITNVNSVRSIDGNVVGQSEMLLSPRTTRIAGNSTNLANIFNSTQ